MEMPKRRDVLAIVLIVLPWTLLVTVWHQSTLAPLLTAHKGEPHPRPGRSEEGTQPVRMEFLLSFARKLGVAISMIQARDLTLLGVWAPLGS